MATTKIRIHGTSYPIRTADGQEEHVQKLGHRLNENVFNLSERLAGADKEYLLVLASIMVLDEMSELENTPKQIEQELDEYKDKLLDTQNHVEALKLQLEKYDDAVIEEEKKAAIEEARQFFADEQDLKFREQRELYEKQIDDLKNQIIENQKGESRPGDLEDLIESSLKRQEQQLVAQFDSILKQQQQKYEQEIEILKKRLKNKDNQQEEHFSLEVDPLFDRLENIAKRAEKA
ncbi:MAG: cell division protein ZapA [Alphaproteobacteria bacterium]